MPATHTSSSSHPEDIEKKRGKTSPRSSGEYVGSGPELASAIAAEYAYHKLKGNTDLSEAYLQNLVDQGVLPGGYESYYLDSLEAAADWIQVHQD